MKPTSFTCLADSSEKSGFIEFILEVMKTIHCSLLWRVVLTWNLRQVKMNSNPDDS